MTELRLVALGCDGKVEVVEQDLLAAPERHGCADGDLGRFKAVGEGRRRRCVVEDAGGECASLCDEGVGKALVVCRAAITGATSSAMKGKQKVRVWRRRRTSTRS